MNNLDYKTHEISESCSCLALYGKQLQDIDFTRAYNFFLMISERYNCTVTHASVSGKHYPEGIKSIKIIDKKLKLNEFRDINSLEVYSVVSENTYQYNWQLYAAIIYSPEANYCEIIICIDEKHSPFSLNSVCDYIKSINEFSSIDYGITYSRSYKQGPNYYASGIIQGLDRNSREAEQLAIWFRAINNDTFFDKNVLRDVYHINFLNKSQLQSKFPSGITSMFSGLTLEQWILNNKIGLLRKISNELWVWQVNERIEHVRGELCKAKLLLHCLPQE